MKKFLSIFFAALLALMVISCEKDKNNNSNQDKETCEETKPQDPILGTRWVSEFSSDIGAWDCSFSCLTNNRTVWTQLTRGMINDVIPGGYVFEGVYELSDSADDGTYTFSLTYNYAMTVGEEQTYTLSGTYDPQKTTMSMTVTNGEVPARLASEKTKPLVFKLR